MDSENEPPIHPPGDMDEEVGWEVYTQDGKEEPR
jgi:hypothetical protein